MCIDEELGVVGGFNEAEMCVEVVGEEKSEVFDELLVLVIRRGVCSSHV